VLTNGGRLPCRVSVALAANGQRFAYRQVVAQYAWALWLAGPVVATALAAVWVWLRGRPSKKPGPKQAMAEHRAYLEALRQLPVDEQAPERAAPAARRSASVAPQPRSTVTR
jgi:hypothetical protein